MKITPIDQLIQLREYARKDKDWELSDKIRDFLDGERVFIFDTVNGQEVYYLEFDFFTHKPDDISPRQYVESRLKRDIKEEANFDAWLYSLRKSIICQK